MKAVPRVYSRQIESGRMGGLGDEGVGGRGSVKLGQWREGFHALFSAPLEKGQVQPPYAPHTFFFFFFLSLI